MRYLEVMLGLSLANTKQALRCFTWRAASPRLTDRCQATREVRAALLRSYGVEVHEAEEISRARFLWQPHEYDLVMLDVRRYSPAEALQFYEQIRAADPRQPVVFLTGPPKYVSRTWPGEVAVDDISRGQWGETVKHFLTAA